MAATTIATRTTGCSQTAADAPAIITVLLALFIQAIALQAVACTNETSSNAMLLCIQERRLPLPLPVTVVLLVCVLGQGGW